MSDDAKLPARCFRCPHCGEHVSHFVLIETKTTTKVVAPTDDKNVTFTEVGSPNNWHIECPVCHDHIDYGDWHRYIEVVTFVRMTDKHDVDPGCE